MFQRFIGLIHDKFVYDRSCHLNVPRGSAAVVHIKPGGKATVNIMGPRAKDRKGPYQNIMEATLFDCDVYGDGK